MIWATIAILILGTWAVGLAVLIDSARHPGSEQPTSDERWTEGPT